MKLYLTAFFLLMALRNNAQQPLPVIKAGSARALITEGPSDRYGWHLNPGLKPDVHTTSKLVRPTRIGFFTDIDSIKTQLQPGGFFEFIVLLNGKDSCYTRIESPPVKNYAA